MEILEYCDKLIVWEKENNYINLFKFEFNILNNVGLGYIYLEDFKSWVFYRYLDFLKIKN